MEAGDLIQARYELERPLGEGGMAEVWLAKDTRLGRPVAVKFLAPKLMDDPEFLVRFFSEAQSVARLTHHNVVKVRDFGDSEGRPHLVMEHVPGGSLADVEGPVMPERALEIVEQAARGAAAAHNIGIVHRDLKPANILLDDQGLPKVADFGIAAPSGGERMTATGEAIGSPHYISPEQVSGRAATPASDVYSLGIVLYQLLTGRRPFEHENVTAAAIAHVEEEPRPPSAFNPDAAGDIDALVMRCLSKDPNDRFSNARALADAIAGGNFWGDPPLDDEPSPALLRTGRTRTIAGIATLVLLLGIFSIVLGAMDQDEPQGRANAEATHEPDNLPKNKKMRKKRAKTIAAEEVQPATASTPTPSPTKTAASDEDKPQKAEPKTQTGNDASTSPSPSPSPTPEPSPTEQPSPAPTPTSSGGSEAGSAGSNANTTNTDSNG